MHLPSSIKTLRLTLKQSSLESIVSLSEHIKNATSIEHLCIELGTTVLVPKIQDVRPLLDAIKSLK